MKKSMLALVSFLLLLCITACSNDTSSNNTQFTNSEEMLKQLEGMWEVAESEDEKTYYIFQDDQLYVTTDAMYSAEVKRMLDNALQNGGIDALLNQNFTNVSDRMYMSDFTIACDQTTLLPQKGEVKLYEGQYDEKCIAIAGDSVLLRTNSTGNSVVMTKISDTADFSMERFEKKYNEVTEKYAVPTSSFWLDPKEYGEMVKTKIPNFDWWTLTSGSDDNGAIYQSTLIPTVNGSLIISKESLTFVYKIKVSSWDNSWEPTLMIDYTPTSGSFQVLDQDNSSLNLLSLVQYGAYAVQNFPGAYQDPLELYNAIANTESAFSYGVETKELTVNGLTYSIQAGTDGTWGRFIIEANETFYLGDLLKNTQEATESTDTVTTPTQSGDLTQLLDDNKSWIGQWDFDGWEYNVHFVFKEDGTCYFALSELELFSAGMGTYTVTDDNTLSVKIMMDGEECSATYAFNPDEFSLTVTSKKGLVAEKGEVVFLQEDTDNDVEQIQSWAEMLADGFPESNEMWE